MLYLKRTDGVIICEHGNIDMNSCGSCREHGGHSLIDLLPEDTLRAGDINCCLGCAQGLPPGLNFGDLCIWGRHGMCMVNVAARVALRFGMIDGAHHKQWVIDQMLRSILGTKDYQEWTKRSNSDPEDDPWDTGICP